MGLTITEKILAEKSGKPMLQSGEIIDVDLDIVMANDLSAAFTIPILKEMGYNKVFDNDKVIFVMDHFVPNANLRAAEQYKSTLQFIIRNGMKHFYNLNNGGIEHVLLPEKGLVLPGDAIIGGDSHTCTYGALGAFSTGVGNTDLAAGLALGKIWLKVPNSIKVIYHGTLKPYVTGKDVILYSIGQIGVDGALYKTLEFSGEIIDELSMDDRFTICNMAVEAGAKNGIIAPDEKTKEYLRNRNKRRYRFYKSDANAKYENVIEYDLSNLEPQVAFPHSPANTKNVNDCNHVKIDQVVIGSCTNGRLSDLRHAAKYLMGRKVHPYVRTLVIPGTQEVYLHALKEGLIEIFSEAGAVVCASTCGPCFGGHMGLLASGEKCVSTTNRNFVGRMGHQESEVYLAGPIVAAASAVAGKITGPKEV